MKAVPRARVNPVGRSASPLHGRNAPTPPPDRDTASTKYAHIPGALLGSSEDGSAASMSRRHADVSMRRSRPDAVSDPR